MASLWDICCFRAVVENHRGHICSTRKREKGVYPNSDAERVEVNDHWLFENDIYLIIFTGD